MEAIINWFFGKQAMTQAKVLNEREIKKCLTWVSAKRHASRNRCMFLLTHQSGMRVGEVAALRICDVLTQDSQIKEEVRLSAFQTKGVRSRIVYLPTKVQAEIRDYLLTRFKLRDLAPIFLTDTNRALFSTQKNSNRGFSANTLAQYFHYLYKEVGIDGASSHSGRRGFITNLANKGVSVRILQELAGHRSLAVTQRYIEVNHQLMRNAVELIN
jgi:integrase/recombinase XerD